MRFSLSMQGGSELNEFHRVHWKQLPDQMAASLPSCCNHYRRVQIVYRKATLSIIWKFVSLLIEFSPSNPQISVEIVGSSLASFSHTKQARKSANWKVLDKSLFGQANQLRIVENKRPKIVLKAKNRNKSARFVRLLAVSSIRYGRSAVSMRIPHAAHSVLPNVEFTILLPIAPYCAQNCE